MKSTVHEPSPTRRSLEIEIPEAEVREEIDRTARRYAKSVRIPGFRPGRTPPDLVRRRYHKEIEAEATEKLAQDATWKVIDENDLVPLQRPEVEELRYEAGQPLRFKAQFDIRPKIQLGNYKGLEVERVEPAVTDELVEKSLESVRERHARFEAVEGRPLAAGDVAIVDTQQLAPDGEARGEERSGVVLELSSDGIPAEQQEQIAGMQVGESREVRTADGGAADAGGTEPAPPEPAVRHRVTLRAIRRKVLPALDDDLAREVGGFESLDALRDRVRDDLRRQAAERAERGIRERLLTQLVDAHDFPAPEVLVAHEQDRMLEQLAGAMAAQGMDPRRAGLDWEKKRAELREPAERRVRVDLLLEEVARAESLEVPDAEIVGALREEAKRAGTTPAQLKAKLERDGRLEMLKIKMLREKSLDLMVRSANIIGNVPRPGGVAP